MHLGRVSRWPRREADGCCHGDLPSSEATALATLCRPSFVAYPYLISKQDYRGAYGVVAEEFGVEFTYADEEIANKHILEKIEKMDGGRRLQPLRYHALERRRRA